MNEKTNSWFNIKKWVMGIVAGVIAILVATIIIAIVEEKAPPSPISKPNAIEEHEVKPQKPKKILKFKFPDSANVIIFNASGSPKCHDRLADSLSIYFPKATFKPYEKEEWEGRSDFGNFKFSSILYSSIEYESIAIKFEEIIPGEQDIGKFIRGEEFVFQKNGITFSYFIVGKERNMAIFIGKDYDAVFSIF